MSHAVSGHFLGCRATVRFPDKEAKPLKTRTLRLSMLCREGSAMRPRRFRSAPAQGGFSAGFRRAKRGRRRRRKRRRGPPPAASVRGAPMPETADSSVEFAALRDRRAAAAAGALRAPRGPPAQGKTNRTDRIACCCHAALKWGLRHFLWVFLTFCGGENVLLAHRSLKMKANLVQLLDFSAKSFFHDARR